MFLVQSNCYSQGNLYSVVKTMFFSTQLFSLIQKLKGPGSPPNASNFCTPFPMRLKLTDDRKKIVKCTPSALYLRKGIEKISATESKLIYFLVAFLER